MQKEKYLCQLCGRSNFSKPEPHNCGGNFRKRGLRFSKILEAGMNLDQWNRLSKNEKNALAAEKILNWTVHRWYNGAVFKSDEDVPLVSFLDDHNAAFQIINALYRRGWYFEISSYGGGGLLARCDLTPDEDMLPNTKEVTGTGSTVPEAIVVAGLRAIGFLSPDF